VQASETILGPVQEVSSPSSLLSDETSTPEQQQQQAQKESNKKDENDDGSTDASLGLINSAPVQVKTNLEQPVTSGGMDTNSPGPGPSN
jgi:hypothetical protein